MTHIIILIKDIENEIVELTEKQNFHHGKSISDGLLSVCYEARITQLKSILSTSKQISLDEKDIEENIYLKANIAMEGGKGLPKGLIEYRAKSVDFAFDKYVEGYKQALKDLL